MDDGRLWVNEKFRELFADHSLEEFSAFYDFKEPESVRQKSDRRIMTFRLDSEGGRKRFWLKRHVPVRSPMKAPGPRELRNILSLRSAGIPTVEPAAAGFEPDAGRSFMVTAEIQNARPLDAFLAEDAKELFDEAQLARFKTRLAGVLGRLVKRFHDAGFNHRDLYLCHVFIDLQSAERFLDVRGDPELTLLDLQRVDYRKKFRRRWIIKDLAELFYSVTPLGVSRTDVLRFALAYLGAGRPGKRELKLGRAVARKAAKIGRHDRKRMLGGSRGNAA